MFQGKWTNGETRNSLENLIIDKCGAFCIFYIVGIVGIVIRRESDSIRFLNNNGIFLFYDLNIITCNRIESLVHKINMSTSEMYIRTDFNVIDSVTIEWFSEPRTTHNIQITITITIDWIS